jgi:hypothetical protein
VKLPDRHATLLCLSSTHYTETVAMVAARAYRF